MLNHVLLFLSPLFLVKNIQINKGYEQNNLKILVDDKSIKQVIINLLSNAVKFSKMDSQINIRTKLKNGKVRIEIEDFGLGIPKKDQSHIFEKFYRVSRPGLEIEGTGLGLPIVKEIIDGHNGKIWFKSAFNVGTTFYLEFKHI